MFNEQEEVRDLIKDIVIKHRESVPGRHTTSAHLYNLKEGLTPEGHIWIHFYSTGAVFHNCFITFNISDDGWVTCEHCMDPGMVQLEEIVFNELEQYFRGEGIKIKIEFEDVIYKNRLRGRRRKLRIMDELLLPDILCEDEGWEKLDNNIAEEDEPSGNPKNIIIGCGGAGNNTINRLYHMRDGEATTSHRDTSTVQTDEKIDKIHFTITAPSNVSPGNNFIIIVWAHLDDHREEIRRRTYDAFGPEKITTISKGPKKIARGTELTVRLKLDNCQIDHPIETIEWLGEVANASFGIHVPSEAPKGNVLGKVLVYMEKLEIMKIDFIINIGDRTSNLEEIPTKQQKHQSAFVSYSRHDLPAVLARVQGLEKAGIKIFLDKKSIPSGAYWKDALKGAILSADIFYLFWSINASTSKWVEKEWRCALKARGIDFIDPIPLDPPEKVPPPAELADKHFYDWIFGYLVT